MSKKPSETNWSLMAMVGLCSWLIPGGGYFVLNEKKRGWIILVTITLLFVSGLYIGSIGVVDKVAIANKPWLVSKLSWYTAQVIVSPVVVAIGNATASGQYEVYGRPQEIGQIYTGIAGLLNFLCIINAVYIGYTGSIKEEK